MVLRASFDTNDALPVENLTGIGTCIVGTDMGIMVDTNKDWTASGGSFQDPNKNTRAVSPVVGWLAIDRVISADERQAVIDELKSWGAGTVPPLKLVDGENGVSLFMQHTRNGNATYWGPDGKLHVVGPDVLRKEYDPVTGLFRGYLIEGVQSTNWVTDVTSPANWTKTGVTVQSTPDPKIPNVFTITATAADNKVLFRQGQPFLVVNTRRNIFVKAGSADVILLTSWSNFISSTRTSFNLTDGTTNGYGNDGRITNLTLKNVGDGWYRVGITNLHGNYKDLTIALGKSSGAIAAGDDLQIALPQNSDLAVDTSPIITNGTAATRAADNWQTKTIDWYSDAQGALIVDFEWIDDSEADQPFVSIGSQNILASDKANPGTLTSSDGTNTLTSAGTSGLEKIAIVWASGQFTMFRNGAKVAGPDPFNGFKGPSDTALKLGGKRTWYRSVRHSPTALADAQAIAETTP